ncbi:MAG TPA: molybdopterin-dependent oxidoreductase [Bryobacteraceae bacterium]|jgi:DMSO/TMAO reductase YedYZ molybdopterin-dependent catalytic subunit
MREMSRRESLRKGLSFAGLLGLSDLVLPVLAQGETDVPFTDYPANFTAGGTGSPRRTFDIRTIDGFSVPKDKFFVLQHFNQPQIDAEAYRLKLSGIVNKPVELSLADLRKMRSTELVAGYECSGNSPRSFQSLASCGRFTGVPLRDVLNHAGVGAKAREVVFLGTDRGEGDVVFRQQTFKLNQQFGRSITLENALKPEPLLAWALNGEPLTVPQGAPLRLIMPGWYGVANVKWLSEIHLQEDRYLGNFQARWYRSVVGAGGTGEEADPGTQWMETEITRMHLKSAIARVRKSGNAYQILGFVLNDGTPLRSVEVKIDEGSWQKATLDSGNSKYSWKLFHFSWDGATPGPHTLVSRVTDADGNVQPSADELKRKKTFLEDNSQFPRKITIS